MTHSKTRECVPGRRLCYRRCQSRGGHGGGVLVVDKTKGWGIERDRESEKKKEEKMHKTGTGCGSIRTHGWDHMRRVALLYVGP